MAGGSAKRGSHSSIRGSVSLEKDSVLAARTLQMQFHLNSNDTSAGANGEHSTAATPPASPRKTAGSSHNLRPHGAGAGPLVPRDNKEKGGDAGKPSPNEAHVPSVRPRRVATRNLSIPGGAGRKRGVRIPCTMQGVKGSWRRFCQRQAASTALNTLTVVLTIFALFGDDMRLILTTKPADYIFDVITQCTIAVFTYEVIVRSFGQPGYIFGFFFWLDIISTCTLVIDITTVSETLFGDEISRIEADDSQGGGGSASSAGSSSAEAARAARMSRVGTKASRVVRLVRLIRLIKFVRCLNRDLQPERQQLPGQDWDFDEETEIAKNKESAVSKKLSEMTTRRVVILVLVIMLGIPCFQDQTVFFSDQLPFSAQYGLNNLYRSWRDGLAQYSPQDNGTAAQAYQQSEERKIYVDDFWMYVYFHNPFCTGRPDSAAASPHDVTGKLFWAGMGPADSPLTEYFLPRLPEGGEYDLNDRWSGQGWQFYQGDLTSDPKALLDKDWQEAQVCLSGAVNGVSLLVGSESRLDCPEGLRYQERAVYFPTSATTKEVEEAYWWFVFDRRSGSRTEALLNFVQTLFICLLLGVGSMTFSNDANKLVLIPIERMIAKINTIRMHPLSAMQIGDEEHRKEQAAAIARREGRSNTLDLDTNSDMRSVCSSTFKRKKLGWRERLNPSNWLSSGDTSSMPEPMETVVLEKTIIKIGSLLALGFGEAGAGIIGHNMKGGDSAALNVMIPGRRVDAIFGYCNIRNFTDATEVLQDQVMIFVNRIASVVHSCINEFFGSPNRNIGDAFLLVWDLEGWDESKQRRLADMSLLSLYKVIAEINKSPLLAEYRSHLKLIKRLPKYRVRLSFGLHKGWAIEGAIGSEFKIDASYLSPNVNLATRLEANTKSYGVLILLSETIHMLMTPDIAEECRRIDHVICSGYPNHFALYTLDLDDVALPLDRKLNPLYSKRSGQARLERHKRRQERWKDEFQMIAVFEEEKDMKIMRRKFTNEFLSRFRMAYLNYEAGEWAVAKDMLEVTRHLLGTEDGPSAALLKFMKQYEHRPPDNWQGYRVLPS